MQKKVSNKFEALPGQYSIRHITGKQLKYYDLSRFTKTIYKNFIELSSEPKLKHNLKEINRLLTSNNTIGLFIFNGRKVIGYLIGEIIKLNDGRTVLYISYLYIAARYRCNGFGTILLNQYIDLAKKINMDAIVLICDTDNQRVLDFYLLKGFMYDIYLRRYDKYDVISLNLY
jgi:Acetyltransferases